MKFQSSLVITCCRCLPLSSIERQIRMLHERSKCRLRLTNGSTGVQSPQYARELRFCLRLGHSGNRPPCLSSATVLPPLRYPLSSYFSQTSSLIPFARLDHFFSLRVHGVVFRRWRQDTAFVFFDPLEECGSADKLAAAHRDDREWCDIW